MSQPRLVLEEVIDPKLLQLALTTIAKGQERAEIEYVHYGLEIVTSCIGNVPLREVILEKKLGVHGTYLEFLNIIET